MNRSALSMLYPRKPYRLYDDLEGFVHDYHYLVLRYHLVDDLGGPLEYFVKHTYEGRFCLGAQQDEAQANRSATQNGLLNLRWSGTEMDSTHRAWAREIQASFKSEFERVHGKGDGEDVPQYINYAEREVPPHHT